MVNHRVVWITLTEYWNITASSEEFVFLNYSDIVKTYSEILCASIKVPQCYFFLSVCAFSAIAISCVSRLCSQVILLFIRKSGLVSLPFTAQSPNDSLEVRLADAPRAPLQGSSQVTAEVPGWHDCKHSLCLGALGAEVHSQDGCTSSSPWALLPGIPTSLWGRPRPLPPPMHLACGI